MENEVYRNLDLEVGLLVPDHGGEQTSVSGDFKCSSVIESNRKVSSFSDGSASQKSAGFAAKDRRARKKGEMTVAQVCDSVEIGDRGLGAVTTGL